MNAFSPSRLTLAALRARGEPILFERDPSAWKARLVAWFEVENGRTLYPDQTEMFLIEMLAYVLATKGEENQAAIIANLAVFAEDRHLDNVAANITVRRLLAQAATVTVRLTLAEARPGQVLVPKGTRLAAGDLIFATDTDAAIPAGQLTIDTVATASEPGTRHNGLVAGQLTASLASIAPGLSAASIDVSSGGADQEDDEHLREVTIDAPERFDRRGGWGGYGFEVRRVNPAIADVAVHRPQPGYIQIYPLLTGGEVPGQALLDQVLDHLDPDTVAPQGDFVFVIAPTPSVFDFTLKLRADPNADWTRLEAEAREVVATSFATMRRPSGAGDQTTSFAPETGSLGAQIAPSAVTAAARGVAGVVDAEAIGLVWQDLAFDRFPRLGVLTVDIVSAADA